MKAHIGPRCFSIPQSHWASVPSDEYLTRGRRGSPFAWKIPIGLPLYHLLHSISPVYLPLPIPLFLYIPLRENPRRCTTGAFNAARFFGFSANRGKRRGFLIDLDPAISSSVETRSLKLLGSKNVRNRNAYRNRIFGIRSCRRFEEEMRSVSSRGGGEMFGALYRGRIK